MAKAAYETRRRRYDTPLWDHRADVLALRDRGRSYRAIAMAISHFRGLHVTAHQVEYILGRAGETPDRSKVRRRSA
jgi:hypothetical protein